MTSLRTVRLAMPVPGILSLRARNVQGACTDCLCLRNIPYDRPGMSRAIVRFSIFFVPCRDAHDPRVPAKPLDVVIGLIAAAAVQLQPFIRDTDAFLVHGGMECIAFYTCIGIDTYGEYVCTYSRFL